MMKNYWLTLHKDTFLWIKGEEGLVYNTLNGQLFRFRNDGMLQSFVADLLRIDNLYKTNISEEQLQIPDVKAWVDSLLAIECATFIENNDFYRRKVSYIPKLKIQDRVSYYKLKHAQGEDGGIMQNLHKLIIHVNGSQYGNELYSKQIIYPQKRSGELSMDSICRFINSFGEPSFLAEIVLVGCLWEHTECDELLVFFKSLHIPISIYTTERDLARYINHTEVLMDEFKVSLNVLFSEYSFSDGYQYVPIFEKSSVYWCSVVTSINECECAEQLITQYQLKNYRLAPVYTRDNLVFFEEHSYVAEEDFYDLQLSKREIFAHQTLNTYFFGKLTIHSDGKVFSDPAQAAIGTIKDSLYGIVYREMVEGNAWFRIRNMQPCNECVYQYLCPSPSPYEKAIGKLNLCHIVR